MIVGSTKRTNLSRTQIWKFLAAAAVSYVNIQEKGWVVKEAIDHSVGCPLDFNFFILSREGRVDGHTLIFIFFIICIHIRVVPLGI